MMAAPGSLLVFLALGLVHMASAADVYTRWGRTECGEAGEEVYTGQVGGGHYAHRGSGANYVCLPDKPTWGEFNTARNTQSGLMYGAEYQISPSTYPFAKELHDFNVPCVVCYLPKNIASFMLPATDECPKGFNAEYTGFVMSSYYGHAGKSEYVCMDGEPEVIANTQANSDGALFYPVNAQCGSLPCPPYQDFGNLACAVCTK